MKYPRPEGPYDFSKMKVICTDVDGTLVFWPGPNPGVYPREGQPGYGEEPKINRPLVDALKKWLDEDLDRLDRVLIVWSRNGPLHANAIAHICRLIEPQVHIFGKPDLVIDDTIKWMDSGREKGLAYMKPGGSLYE